MNYEMFDNRLRRNIWTSIILIFLFFISTAFEISDHANRLLELGRNIVGYEKPVLVAANGDGAMEKRLNLAKLESVHYKIPSSSIAVIKFLSLPMLNNFHLTPVQTDPYSTHATVTTVSPLKSVSGSYIFDGADCRFGIEASSFDKKKMIAKLEVKNLSCTDNEGYAYSTEFQYPLGYVSEITNPGIPVIKILNSNGYLTIDPYKNYLVQFYEPIEAINKRGISFFGRF